MINPKNFFDDNGKFKAGGNDIIHNHTLSEKTKFEGFFQPILIYNREVKIKRKMEPIAFTFCSNTVFTTKEEAAGFLPFYIRQLIESGDLPKDVLNDDNTVNEKLLIPSFMKLDVGHLEKE